MNKHLCIIFAFYCQADKAEFLPHFALRIAAAAPPGTKISVLYYGHMDEDLLTEKGLQVFRMKGFRSKILFALFKWPILFWNALIFGITKKFDIFINVHQHINFLYIAMAAKLLKIKCIARITGELTINEPKGLRKKMNYQIKRFKERISLFLSDKIITLSESLKNSVLARGIPGDNIYSIAQGVDVERFQFQDKRRLVARNVLYIGRLRNSKGLREAINAFKSLSQKYPDLQFNIYGNGADEAKLIKLADDHPSIHFHGHISNIHMPHILAFGDILLLPSYMEGLPNVILEAMASGVAVIASNVGGIPELLEDGECGLLIPPRDTEAIEKAVDSFMKYKKMRRIMVDNAFDRITDFYSMEHTKKHYKELFDAL
jgi:glycosyltransferase involved in cell wall biosynthesis